MTAEEQADGDRTRAVGVGIGNANTVTDLFDHQQAVEAGMGADE